MKGLLYIFLIVFTLVAALLALLGFVSGYVHPQGWEWLSFPGLILLPVLGVNLAIFLLWSLKGSEWKWVPLAALLLNIGFIFCMFQIGIRNKEDVRGQTVKLITYNVDNFHADGHPTLEAIAYWAEAEHPDVVCLQECPREDVMPMDSIAKAFSFLPHVCTARPERGGSALAIFSRYPIVFYEPVFYPETTNKSLLAVLRVGNDTVRLVNNHLQTTSVNEVKPRLYQAKADRSASDGTEAAFRLAFAMKRNFVLRAEQADYVREWIGKEKSPVLVCGDFNDTPASYAYHRIKGNLVDGFRDSGAGFGYTFRELGRLFRIDYVFYSSHFTGRRYDAPDLPFSDHKPVVCVVSFGNR